MRYGILPGLALLLCACQTVRTVYDEYGNEVKETQGGGGEKDLSTHMEERFNASFSEKKNAQGVPQAVSNRVSAFQKDLKDASLNKEYFTKNYDGSGANEMSSMSFSGSDKRFSGAKEAYSGAMRDRIEKELHPAFASGSKGIYATDDAFAGSNSRYARESTPSSMDGKSYGTQESYYSRDMESGYIETRRESMPDPRVMTKDEYYRKSIQETRTMLGRDKDE